VTLCCFSSGVSQLTRFDALLNLQAVVALRDLQIVRGLQVEPRLRIAAKVPCETQRGICRDAAPLADDIVDAASSDAEGVCQCVRAHLERDEVILAKNFARMDRAHTVFKPGHIKLHSVIVGNFHVGRTFIAPRKAQTPLTVDADAVLAEAITFQRFESVARR